MATNPNMVQITPLHNVLPVAPKSQVTPVTNSSNNTASASTADNKQAVSNQKISTALQPLASAAASAPIEHNFSGYDTNDEVPVTTLTGKQIATIQQPPHTATFTPKYQGSSDDYRDAAPIPAEEECVQLVGSDASRQSQQPMTAAAPPTTQVNILTERSLLSAYKRIEELTSLLSIAQAQIARFQEVNEITATSLAGMTKAFQEAQARADAANKQSAIDKDANIQLQATLSSMAATYNQAQATSNAGHDALAAKNK
jgi:hypothetical protein